MEIGLITSEISRPSSRALMKAISDYGFTAIQLDLSSLVGEYIPENIDINWVQNIADEAKQQGIKIIAVNGTFNMAHPDSLMRKKGLKRLRVIAHLCKAFGSNLVTLCGGSRNPGDPFDLYNMWVRNPENNTIQAWQDMSTTFKEALKYAQEYGIYMGIEPEEGIVVNSARKARQLLDEMASPWLKIILDGANLFHKGESDRMREILTEAFDLLGKDIIMVHGKDLAPDPDFETPSPFAPFVAPGKGILDYDTFIELLNSYNYKGGFILHGFKKEQEIPDSVAFIIQKLAEHRREGL